MVINIKEKKHSIETNPKIVKMVNSAAKKLTQIL